MIAQLSRVSSGSVAGSVGGSENVDHCRAARAIRELLLALGEDPDREGLRDTPRRVARMFAEVFRGLREDPEPHLTRTFAEAHSDLVILKDIDFASFCEHHLLPFIGRVHIAYIPAGRVVGLSKLARTVDVFARRPQVQERLTGQIADAIMKHVRPLGVFVKVESEHLCMKVRGVSKQRGMMVTTVARGVLETDSARRAEVAAQILNPRAC